MRLLHQYALAADLSEYLSQILGRSVRVNPQAFLRAVVNEPLCSDAFPAGDIFVDRDEARAIETRARLKAIQTVSRPELALVRKKCEAALESEASNDR